MTKIAFITAMEKEFNEIKKLYDFQPTSDGLKAVVDGKELMLVQCGMGKVNAAIAADRLCRQGVDTIISAGVAGGIDLALAQGDVVVSDRVCYHDVWCGEPCVAGQMQNLPLYFETPLAKSLGPMDQTVKVGLIVTGDQFVTDPQRLKQIKSTFPEAVAVDMESAAIAHVCYLNRVRFLSVRIISDVVGAAYQEEDYRHFFETCATVLVQKTHAVLRALWNSL